MIHAAFLSTACYVHARLKKNRQSDKKETLTNNEDKKYNSMKHLNGQKFLFTKTCIESDVSLKILSHE